LVWCSQKKPRPVRADALCSKKNKLGMNVFPSMVLCIILFHDNNKNMKPVRLRLDVMDIIIAPKITISMTFLLEDLIEKHHKPFVTLPQILL
jgi:hypothetical protein